MPYIHNFISNQIKSKTSMSSSQRPREGFFHTHAANSATELFPTLFSETCPFHSIQNDSQLKFTSDCIGVEIYKNINCELNLQ